MIKITIEILPFGSEHRKKVLAHAVLANDGTGTNKRGRYTYSLWKKREQPWRMGIIDNFPRKSYGVWKLLYLILKDVFE